MNRFFSFLLGLVFLTLVACSKDEPTSPTTNNNNQQQQQQQFTDFRIYTNSGENADVFGRDIKDFTYAALRDMYYWSAKVPTTIIPSTYESPEKVLEAARYLPDDRFSYLVKDGNAFLNSVSTGESKSYGVYFKSDPLDQLRIAQVEEGSPAAAAGLKRGMILKSLNGTTRFNIITGIASIDSYNSVNAIVLDESTGKELTVNLEKATFNKKTVLKSFVTSVAGKKAGYLLFTQFSQSSVAELDQVFTTFKAEGISELILDMRYNGGGSVATSQHLASLIATQLNGTIFVRQAHNDRYSAWNKDINFESKSNGLQLKRLFVIMTGNTASASELIINGLNPHIQVITIGSKSYGKNNGFYPILHEKSGYVVAVVNIISQNSLGDGNYSAGFTPTRPEVDDVTQDFGNSKEKCYAAALYYIEKGGFPTIMAKHQAEITAMSNKPLYRDDKFLDYAPMIFPAPKSLNK